MIKIIDGVRYDTEKSTAVGTAGYSHTGDLDYWHETLYKAPRSGRFFVHGEGGPRSRYSRQTSNNNWSGSERIRPIALEDARKWCEDYLDGDDWAKHFPAESIEDA